MSIIQLVFDLFRSIRDPFNNQIKRKRVISIAGCITTTFIALSIALVPFIWWYGSETELKFCSIGNVYGLYFHDYHIVATSFLAVLFFLMIVTSFLLLHEIKKTIAPRRPKLSKLSIPIMFREDRDGRTTRRLKQHDSSETDAEDSIIVYAGLNGGNLAESGKEMALPDLVSDVEKTTISLSDYSGIENVAFDSVERRSIQIKILQQLSEDANVAGAELEVKSNVNSEIDANPGAIINEELSSIDENQNQPVKQYIPYAKTENELKEDRSENQTATSISGSECANKAYESNEDENQEDSGKKGASSATETTQEHISTASTLNGTKQENRTGSQSLSADTKTPYRGSRDKVGRLTGTDMIGPEMAKELATLNGEQRKKFMQACKTVAAFMTAFIGCCLPYYILSIVQLTQGRETEDSNERRLIRAICAAFLYLLPIVDPILYTLRFDIIRKTLCRILRKCCRRNV